MPVDPEEIAFGSVDDDVAAGVARSMGWRGWSNVIPQEPVRLPEFGPRKIHSTPEIIRDPLLDDLPIPNYPIPSGLSWPTTIHTQALSAQVVFNGVPVVIPINGTAVSHGLIWSLTRLAGGQLVLDYTAYTPATPNTPASPPPSKKPQWARPFYENRPTERPKVGRTKRRRR